MKPLKRSHSDADEVGEDVKLSLKKRLSATSLTSFVSSQSHEKIIKLLVEMVVDDMLPIATVEHKGFRNLISYLAPTFPIPSRRSITARLEAKYDELKAKSVQLLGGDSSQGVALTTDMWKSIATEGYIGVTAHYIDQSWCLRSLVLSTEAMEERHTAVNISQRLREISMEWKSADSNSTEEEEEEEEEEQQQEEESAGSISAMSFLIGASSSGSPQTPESDKVTRYKAEPVVLDSEDPLKWWKKNEERFPVLAQVCKSILSIPATSTPSQRLFSAAGLICS